MIYGTFTRVAYGDGDSMSQATVAGGYYNSNLFSNYYLDERVYDLDAWNCDDEASEAMQELGAMWDEERDAVECAAELDEQIRLTDELIDEIVYELYGLTDEEVAIVEEAVRG